MARKYRKKRGHDEWHFCTNCTNWPTSDYIENDGEPSYGELCDQCKSKEKASNCTAKY